ncbi:glucosidase II, partial [Coemansia spiralis]
MKIGARGKGWPVGLLCVATVALSLALTVDAVKREDFKTCDQSAFCLRHRQFAEAAGGAPTAPAESQYSVVPGSVRLDQHTLVALVEQNGDRVPLKFETTFLAGGTIRV